MSWATDDGWEDSSWGVIATEASLDHSRAIVDNEGSYIFLRIRHAGLCISPKRSMKLVIRASERVRVRVHRKHPSLYTTLD